MEIALHLGAHCTDEDRLLACLLKNQAALGEQGIAVPPVGRYRPVIRQLIHVIKNRTPSLDTQQTLIDTVVDADNVKRIVLSHDSFLGVPGRSVEKNALYAPTAFRAPRLRALFNDFDVSLFIAIRDPASFIPAVFARANETNFDAFMDGTDALSLRWSDMLTTLRKSVPNCPITVWCNEDTPLIWNEILERLSGHAPGFELEGRDDFLGSLMNETGRRRMASYLEAHPPQNERQRRRIVTAFLDKFALNDAFEDEIDVPGWNEDYVDHLSALYDRDLEVIRALPGITLIEP